MNKRMIAWIVIVGVLAGVLPLVSAQDEFGSNWTIAYFNNLSPDGAVVTSAVVSRIDFNFRDTPPGNGVNIEAFAARAESSVTFVEGTYRFTLGSDDGARLFLNGTSILDRFSSHPYTEDTVDVFVSAGVKTLRVEYFQNGGDARLRLFWTKLSDSNLGSAATTVPTQDTTTGLVVPPPPDGQVALGTVVSVEGLSVRSGPYLGGSLLDVVVPGYSYPVFARNTDEGEFTWYYIEARDYIIVTPAATQANVNGTPVLIPTVQIPYGQAVRGWVSGRYFQIIQGDANAIPFAGDVFDASVNPASTGVQGVLRSNMRLRQGPSYRTPTLAILDWGAEVEIVGRTIQSGNNYWFQVIYQGQPGWLFADFVAVYGNIEQVPRY